MPEPAWITSRNNPKIKFLRSLQQRRTRETTGLFLVEGIRPVGEALSSGITVDGIYYAPDLLTSDYALELIEGQAAAGTPCFALDRDVFASIADKDNPQGILAVVRQPHWSLSGLTPQNFPWGVALVAPQDPGNVGSILRTVDAVGASGLILLETGVDLAHPTLVRASMGALFWFPVLRTSFAEFTTWARQFAYHVVGTSAHAAQDYRTIPSFNFPLILLMGSEREGLSPEQAATCDTLIRLPMRGRSTSLNLAIATGVLLYSILERLPLPAE